MSPRPHKLPSRSLWVGFLLTLLTACGQDEPKPIGTQSAPTLVSTPPAPRALEPSQGSEESSVAQTIKAARSGTELAKRMQNVDPAVDSWSTEVVNEKVGVQLKKLQKMLESGEPLQASALQHLIHEGFVSTPLRPQELAEGYSDGSIGVRRGQLDTLQPSQKKADGLAAALNDLITPYASGAAARLHVKFKVIGVEVIDHVASTPVLVQLSGQAEQGVYEQNSSWAIDWYLPDDEAIPLLASIRLEEHEEVESTAGALFGDCTEAVIGADPSFGSHINVNLENWLGNIQRRFYDGFYGHNGISVADVNGDGLDDVYLCQASSLPNRLYIQQPDGTARDMAPEAGIDFLDSTGAVLFLDFDEDDDQDLLLSMDQALVFFENDGSGKFEVRWYRNYAQVRSISAADYDNDGDLDIYCCCYKIPDENGVTPLPYHDANNGEPNIFLRNDGDWKFTDITAESGFEMNNRRFSFASSWEDYDEDGDLDLYVANDFGRNNLYRNDGGTFTDVAPEAGVEDISAGMSVTWGDYNNDGLMDIYVSNMYSSAGKRVTYQRSFMENEDEATRSLFQRHAHGNSLFVNAGDGTFKDVSYEAGVTMGRWSWSSKFVDLNNDGLQDLVAANGFVTNEEPQDL